MARKRILNLFFLIFIFENFMIFRVRWDENCDHRYHELKVLHERQGRIYTWPIFEYFLHFNSSRIVQNGCCVTLKVTAVSFSSYCETFPNRFRRVRQNKRKRTLEIRVDRTSIKRTQFEIFNFPILFLKYK